MLTDIAATAAKDAQSWNMVTSLGVLLSLATSAIALLRGNRTAVTPDPLRIEKLDRFATRDFCELQHRQVQERIEQVEGRVTGFQQSAESISRQMHEMETRINAAGEDRISKVHMRINDVLAAVSQLQGKVL